MQNRTSVTSFLIALFVVTAVGTAPVRAQSVTESPAGYFAFHIDPWVSLHHFAYHFVREEHRELKLRSRVPLHADDRERISTEFRQACAALQTAYRPYIDSSLLFDAKTRRLGREISSGPDAVTDVAVRDALKQCMPVYETTLWPSHQAAGKQFQHNILIRLQAYEEEMATRFASNLESSWPDSPIRVDITPYANWAGAYTDDSPANIIMSSYDDEVAGTYAFEILFHESGHTLTFSGNLLSAANAALESAGIESNRFWHYVLFFVAGRTTSEVFDESNYVPFSVYTGLTESESAAVYYKALEQTWDAGGSFHDRVRRAAQLVAEEQGANEE